MIADDARNLCYLLGLPRSGTTLLSVLLARHPAIAVPPEPWLMLALETFGKVPLRHPAEAYLLGEAGADFTRGLDLARAAAAAARSLYDQHLAASGRAVFVDKTPRYWQIAGFLAAAFPGARFLWLLRNPMAVAASLKKTWGFDPLAPASVGQNEFMRFDLVLGSHRLLAFADAHPEVHRVRYEELVAEEEAVMDGVLHSLGLDPAAADRVFDPNRARPPGAAMGDRKILETGGVHTAAVESWKHDLTVPEMQAVFDALGRDLLERLGYGDTVEELRRLGVEDRGPEVADAAVADLEDRFARRLADLERGSRCDPAHGWPFALREAVDLAYADPARVLQADYRIGELEGILQAHKDLIGRMDREHVQAIEEHRVMVADLDAAVRQREQSLDEHRAMVADLAAVVRQREQSLDEHRAMVADLAAVIRQREQSLDEHRAMVADLAAVVRQREQSLDEHRAMVADLDAVVRQRDRSIREHQELVWSLDARLRLAEADRAALRGWADAVVTSRSGRLMTALGRLSQPPHPVPSPESTPDVPRVEGEAPGPGSGSRIGNSSTVDTPH